MTKRTNPDFLNGVPELLILRLLARRPMHGYELVQSLKNAGGESLAFGEGCVYPILHRLEAEKLLAKSRQAVAGRQRLVYRVTPAGRERLAASVSAWRRVTAAVSQVLQGGSHAAVNLAQ
jgi:PadR family transcriptional regulator PadR